MHGLLLGVLKRHVRKIWGMDVKFHDGDGKSFDNSKNTPSDEKMQEAHKILRAGSRTALGKLKAPVLRQLCRDTQSMRFAYKKKRLLASLIEYVSCIAHIARCIHAHLMCQRIERGWFTRDGRVVVSHRDDHSANASTPTPRSTPSQPANTDDLDLKHATAILEASGTKKSLRSLRKAALVALCSVKLQHAHNYDYNKDTVETLLSKLTAWVCCQ